MSDRVAAGAPVAAVMDEARSPPPHTRRVVHRLARHAMVDRGPTHFAMRGLPST
jgi:hypothetical protein